MDLTVATPYFQVQSAYIIILDNISVIPFRKGQNFLPFSLEYDIPVGF